MAVYAPARRDGCLVETLGCGSSNIKGNIGGEEEPGGAWARIISILTNSM